MRLSELLTEAVIKVGLEAEDKEEAFEELVDLLVRAGRIADRERALEVLRSREELQSTGIGRGLAIPHGKDAGIHELNACLGISREGIEYDSLDGELVRVVFLLLAQKDNPGPHIEALSQIAKLFMVEGFIERLVNAGNPCEVLSVFAEFEEGQED
ncbi:MAG: PTS sugar transporter subunit IIA [Candidatus Eisenbacteria bacterium]|nr:PTS sugar transporter subunit IIA [Candidatus Eisenbacteria bacterium]